MFPSGDTLESFQWFIYFLFSEYMPLYGGVVAQSVQSISTGDPDVIAAVEVSLVTFLLGILHEELMQQLLLLRQGYQICPPSLSPM